MKSIHSLSLKFEDKDVSPLKTLEYRLCIYKKCFKTKMSAYNLRNLNEKLILILFQRAFVMQSIFWDCACPSKKDNFKSSQYSGPFLKYDLWVFVLEAAIFHVDVWSCVHLLITSHSRRVKYVYYTRGSILQLKYCPICSNMVEMRYKDIIT